MNITSMEFLAFTLLTAILYYILPSKAQNPLLLVASYLFLMSWHPQFVLIFLILTIINYKTAFYIAKKGKIGKFALYFGIGINLFFLLYLKYADFFIPSAMHLLESMGIQIGLNTISILLPIGLSFFVIQVISYLIDVNKGITSPSTNILTFALYMVYFPRVVSGPVERFNHFISKLENKRQLNNAVLSESFVLILQGLVRKIVIADLLFYIMPQTIFKDPLSFTSPELAVWLLAYSFAIYNDFAGYSSIIRGVSVFFGISLNENFRTPYLSQSFTEFWQRWHISLSNWLKDYIFMPTTRYFRSRRSALNDMLSIIIPPIVTMFISALWHNISPNLFVWGGLYSIYLIGERYLTLNKTIKQDAVLSGWKQVLATGILFLLVSLAWVPFHADLDVTLMYWSRLLSPLRWVAAFTDFDLIKNQIFNKYGVDIILLTGLSIFLDIVHDRAGELAIIQSPPFVKALALNLAVFGLVIALMAISTPPPFVYQGF